MSTISEKNKNQTRERTNLYQKKSHGSNYYERRNSVESKSTVSQFSMNNLFEVSTSTLMPLVLRVKEENQYLSQQKTNMQKEMECLKVLSDNLLIENEKLRTHYHERSSDIQGIISTMTLNTNQQISDTKHLIHGYRQSNRLMIKNIEQRIKKTQQLDHQVKKITNSITSIRGKNLELEEIVRAKAIKKRQFSHKSNQMDRQQNRFDLNLLQGQISDLTHFCYQLKSKNIATIKYVQQEKFKIGEEKPITTKNTIDAIKGVKILQEQNQQFVVDQRKQQIKHDQLKINIQKLAYKLTSQIKQQQRKSLALQLHNQKNRSLVSQINKLKEKQKKQNPSQLSKKQAEKKQLMQQVQNKRNQIEKQRNGYKEKKLEIEKKNKKEIESVQQKIKQINLNYDKIKEQQVNPEILGYESRHEELKEQQNNLDEQIRLLENKVNELTNPMKEILTLEYQLKRIKK